VKVKYLLGFLCPQILFTFLDNKHQIVYLYIKVFLGIYYKLNIFWVKGDKKRK
jgi:hypothetical protein